MISKEIDVVMDRNFSRPTVPRSHVAPQAASAAAPAQPVTKRSRRPKKLWWIVGAVVLLALAAMHIAMWTHMGAKQPATDRYQAVFMNNGQVFFGKLKNVNGTYLKLEKAYYTKKQDVPSTATDEQKKAIENNISLVKVGDEVYGPENIMMIRSDQVLFWQDLKSDSKVAKAIDDSK